MRVTKIYYVVLKTKITLLTDKDGTLNCSVKFTSSLAGSTLTSITGDIVVQLPVGILAGVTFEGAMFLLVG